MQKYKYIDINKLDFRIKMNTAINCKKQQEKGRE